jgi:hypothetical protein
MELTKEEALKYYRQMLMDMQKKHGDNPSWSERGWFKHDWLTEHFPGEKVCNNCFLCEYSTNMRMLMDYDDCVKCCPIDWEKAGMEDCCDYYGPDHDLYYSAAPISEILALPERETIE